MVGPSWIIIFQAYSTDCIDAQSGFNLGNFASMSTLLALFHNPLADREGEVVFFGVAALLQPGMLKFLLSSSKTPCPSNIFAVVPFGVL